MVQLNLKAAQGASAGLYPILPRQVERGEHPEGVHPLGTDGFWAGAAFALFAPDPGPTKQSSLAHAKKSILPLHYFYSKVVLITCYTRKCLFSYAVDSPESRCRSSRFSLISATCSSLSG
jgi:hypothetical protein